MRRLSRAMGCAAAASSLLAGCALPDLQRGEEALKAGDPQQAERDFKPLAELGYSDARLQLARVYAQSGDPKSLKQAEALYRSLLAEDPEVAVPLAKLLMQDGTASTLRQAEALLREADQRGDERALVPLIELLSDYPDLDPKNTAPKLLARAAKREDLEAETAVIRWLRRRSPNDDKLAQELVRRCSKARDRVPDCYVELARHYRSAGALQELEKVIEAASRRFNSGGLPQPVLEKLGWTLVSDDLPGLPHPEAALPMLQRAAQTSALAQVRLARLLIEYPHLDPDARPDELLTSAAQQGHPEAALALGRLYINGRSVPADPAKAERFLQQASDSLPAAHYYLGRMYKRGELGWTDPVRAAQHLLTAARGGYARADRELARLFSDNRGVRVNPVNAYVFARLAADNGVPESAELLRQLTANLGPRPLREAQRLLQMELAVREATASAPQQDRAELRP